MTERWRRELRNLRTLEPPPDLWDRARSGPRRGHVRARRPVRVFGPVAAALAIALVAGTLLWIQPPTSGRGSQGSALSTRAGHFTDPRFGWTIRYPAGLLAAHFGGNGFVDYDGVRITNFRPDLHVPSQGLPRTGWLRDFPTDGVALQIWFEERIPAPPPLRDSALPLARASFSRTRPYAGGKEPAPYYRSFYGNGFGYSAAVWIGPHASQASVRAIWVTLRSLRFPALRLGTIWQHRYYVLGQAARYRAGTVTFVPAGSLPAGLPPRASGAFYLVHAPRAFYIIGQAAQNPTRASVKCQLSFDPRAFQFFCPGTGLRWNRVGQPIGAHRGSGWDLPLTEATVAQDGHILVSPSFGAVLGIVLRGNPWR
ncbi:MAG: hypothetical protein ACYCVZ_08865 [Streptosporangiaceae bacterium]